MDQEKCIGCMACVPACPYEGVRTLNDAEPAWSLGFASGDAEATAQLPGTIGKCTMCAHRVARGERPACIDVCQAVARFWGDLDDPASQVSQLLETREYYQLLPEKGTEPSAFYLK